MFCSQCDAEGMSKEADGWAFSGVTPLLSSTISSCTCNSLLAGGAPSRVLLRKEGFLHQPVSFGDQLGP